MSGTRSGFARRKTSVPSVPSVTLDPHFKNSEGRIQKNAQATSMTRMRMGFSDKNWVQIGLKWVRFHFLKKAKLVKSSMFNRRFAFFELGSFSRFCVFNQRDGR